MANLASYNEKRTLVEVIGETIAPIHSARSEEGAAINENLRNEAQLVSSKDNVITEDGEIVLGQSSLNDEELKKNIFQDPEIADYYRKLYANSQYEGRHHFDPELEWTAKEEKAILWKLEWRVTLWACIMFIGLQIDRGNLVQATSDNMLKDLNLTTNQYNYGNTIFYVCFLSAELPSQLVSKMLGPDRFIPLQMVLWSIVAMSQAALKGKNSFYATRALLGILEGGFIPDIVLWLSFFYTSKELPIRLSFFWTALSVTTIITSIMAYGLLRLRGVCGMPGWAWLFLIEGLITLLIGLASFFMMPASAVQTKTWFRKKGWFTEREEKIVVNRVLRDDPSKGDMHNRQAITPKLLWESLKDYDLFPIYMLGLIAYIPATPQSFYISLMLKSLGFSTFNTNLLAIPYNVIHIIMLLLVTKASDIFNDKFLVAVAQPLWLLPLLVAMRWWPGAQQDAWATWAIVTLLLGYPYIHAILVALCSRNSNTVRTRSVSAATYNMFVQAGNIISSNIYRTDDAPLYKRGNMQLFWINIGVLGLLLFSKAYYMWRNHSREKIWSKMTKEEKFNYLATTTDKGNKRLDFRFAH
ncbi:hypothetical protein AWJ20_906 [Sugiyamaella lignohabitans]|uniref:Allantoate permease n=1 Tax=Sugiyamaella lignohabitans TaxID=796027 RepID=A0A167D9I1_9ASCO|nr:uncharacterized protein AWJ20_906 [Sugiyamaella lignohabitans]ANB12645.1 hypothetical protein AWJ20_906 [Sugiyamaella lignohabitans]